MSEVSANILATLEAYADAWRRGDLAQLAASYHDEFTLHYPGTHGLAGVHRGKAAALRVLAEVAKRTRRRLIEITSVMAGETHGAIVAREEWRREDVQATVERVLLYTVRDGKLEQCWLYDADQNTVATFLG